MSNFRSISPRELSDNPFSLIGHDWMLVTSGNAEHFNTMTASWGGVGFLWNKNVCYVYIRPQRYTYEFVEKNETLTLSFFSEKYRDALNFCGKHSGRDTDKCKATGLTPRAVGSCVAFEQARLILRCRVLYKQDMLESAFLDKSLLSNYKNGDFHRAYVCEIEEILVSDSQDA